MRRGSKRCCFNCCHKFPAGAFQRTVPNHFEFECAHSPAASRLINHQATHMTALHASTHPLTPQRRHGRLERCVLVPPPSLAARFDILSRHLAVMGDATVDPALIRATAVSTRGFSGADLENLCRSAGVFASARGTAAVGSEDIAAVIGAIWVKYVCTVTFVSQGLGSVRCSLNSNDVQLAKD